MSDNSPDQPGGNPPGGGSRRSGLDRLRAARGGSEEPTSDGVPPADPSDEAGRRRSGVLLDEPRDGAADVDAPTGAGTHAEPATDAGSGAPDGGDTGGSGSRSRRRTAAKGAAVDTSADSEKSGPAANPRFGRLRRGRSTSASTAAAAGPASQRQKIAALLLGLVIIGLLVPVVIMRHRIAGESSEDRAVSDLIDKRTVALTTARQFAVTFFSPDYKTIDDYNKAVLAGSTGQFNQDFASKQGDLKALVTKAKSQATGRILAAGVSKVSGDDVEVLVVADQDVQNTLTKGRAQTLRTRVRVTVHKTDQRWLVSGFEPVT